VAGGAEIDELVKFFGGEMDLDDAWAEGSRLIFDELSSASRLRSADAF
jgi:hypothetical protein